MRQEMARNKAKVTSIRNALGRWIPQAYSNVEDIKESIQALSPYTAVLLEELIVQLRGMSSSTCRLCWTLKLNHFHTPSQVRAILGPSPP